jgi:CheY-like chemotaxis protein
MTEAAAGQRRRILVAEDDDAARVLITKYLESKGHTVTAVPDGQAVMDALAGDEEFELLILDVMMPKLSGFDVLERARKQGFTLPIIMATAAANPADVVRALSLGADDYVTKPYSFPVLLARIELRMRPRPAVPQPPPPPPLPQEESFHLAPDDVEMIEDAGAGSSGEGLLARLKSIAGKLRNRSAPKVEELKEGTVLAGRYQVGRRIGLGGFGAVYRARHIDLAQDVALKVLHSGASSDSVEAFRREAQNCCRVRHPNAVRVFDFGLLPQGSAFLAMELLEGPTLEYVLAKVGKLPLERAVPIVRSVLGALGAVHKQGLVHRDVKPGNVLLHSEDERQVPRLLDFGIAADVDDPGDRGNVVAGSASYISPERWKGMPYDGRADIYACGVMLFRMLTGALPFDLASEDYEKVALWHVHQAPPAPSSKVGGLPRQVDELMAKLLAKDPAARPNAAEADSLLMKSFIFS